MTPPWAALEMVDGRKKDQRVGLDGLDDLVKEGR